MVCAINSIGFETPCFLLTIIYYFVIDSFNFVSRIILARVILIPFVILYFTIYIIGCGISLDNSNGTSFFRNITLSLKCLAIS